MLCLSFSGEKSYSPSRLRCRQATVEPWATASVCLWLWAQLSAKDAQPLEPGLGIIAAGIRQAYAWS